MNYRINSITLLFVLLGANVYSQSDKDSLSIVLNNYSKQIHFEIGKTKLKHNVDISIFTKIAALMIKNSKAYKFELSGHTSSVGSKVLNRELSQRRADLLKNIFVEYGVNPLVLSAIGEGEERPLTHNNFPESRASNKRIEVKVISQ
jgi:outer membrane protein OmpA-like peptidoglycan-associated protein